MGQHPLPPQTKSSPVVIHEMLGELDIPRVTVQGLGSFQGSMLLNWNNTNTKCNASTSTFQNITANAFVNLLYTCSSFSLNGTLNFTMPLKDYPAQGSIQVTLGTTDPRVMVGIVSYCTADSCGSSSAMVTGVLGGDSGGGWNVSTNSSSSSSSSEGLLARRGNQTCSGIAQNWDYSQHTLNMALLGVISTNPVNDGAALKVDVSRNQWPYQPISVDNVSFTLCCEQASANGAEKIFEWHSFLCASLFLLHLHLTRAHCTLQLDQ